MHTTLLAKGPVAGLMEIEKRRANEIGTISQGFYAFENKDEFFPENGCEMTAILIMLTTVPNDVVKKNIKE